MSIDNIDILIKSYKKLITVSNDILKALRGIAKDDVTTKDASYLHYNILNSLRDINCVIGDIHDVVDDETKKNEDDLR